MFGVKAPFTVFYGIDLIFCKISVGNIRFCWVFDIATSSASTGRLRFHVPTRHCVTRVFIQESASFSIQTLSFAVLWFLSNVTSVFYRLMVSMIQRLKQIQKQSLWETAGQIQLGFIIGSVSCSKWRLTIPSPAAVGSICHSGILRVGLHNQSFQTPENFVKAPRQTLRCWLASYCLIKEPQSVLTRNAYQIIYVQPSIIR